MSGIEKRNKLYIRFVDKSLGGKTAAEEFESESDDLADNSEDEKKLRSTPYLRRHDEAAQEENCEARWGIWI
jgi:hypothetical protein